MAQFSLASLTDDEVNWAGVRDSDVESDVPLLEDDGTSLLCAPTKHARKPLSRKYSLTTIALLLLSVFLAGGLVALVLKYVARNMKTNNNNKKTYYDKNVGNENHQLCRNRRQLNGVEILKSSTTAIFGRIRCDSPTDLLESLKNHLRKVMIDLGDGVEFMLLTGDQVGHVYKRFDVNVFNSVLWTIANGSKIISSAHPGIPLLISIGNNDLEVDYGPPVSNHSAFYQSLYNIIEAFVFPKGSKIGLLNTKDEFKKTFLHGGYYSVVLSNGKIVVVVLNTNYWSTSAYNVNNAVTTIGDVQVKWLHDQLHAAMVNKQKVIITGHIPPGIDSFNGKSFWLYNYTRSYVMMVTHKYPYLVIGQLYGHTHQDKIKLQSYSDKHKSFSLTCPSVTPVDGNNPAFRVFDYNHKGQFLQDYTQYHLDLAASNVNKEVSWVKEYSFRGTYNVGLTSEGVEQIVNKLLQPSSSVWFHYSQHMKAMMGGILYYQRYVEFCAAKHFLEEGYMNCIKKYENVGI